MNICLRLLVFRAVRLVAAQQVIIMLEPERHMIYSALIVVLLASNLISIGSDADPQGNFFDLVVASQMHFFDV